MNNTLEKFLKQELCFFKKSSEEVDLLYCILVIGIAAIVVYIFKNIKSTLTNTNGINCPMLPLRRNGERRDRTLIV